MTIVRNCTICRGLVKEADRCALLEIFAAGHLDIATSPDLSVSGSIKDSEARML